MVLNKIPAYILSLCLFIPIFSRFFLISSIETNFKFLLFDYFPIYIFDLTLIPYIIFGKKNKKLDLVNLFCLLVIFVCTLISLFTNNYEDRFLSFFFGNFLILGLFFTIFYNLSDLDYKIFYYLCLTLIFYIFAQVILYSFQILDFESFSDFVSLGDLIRINTSIGAATGSSFVIIMLSLFCYFYSEKKYQILFLSIPLISSFLLVSRTAIIISSILFLLHFLFSVKLKLNIWSIAISIITIYAIFSLNLLDPLTSRLEYLEYVDDNDRLFRLIAAQDLLNEYNYFFGVGVANTFQSSLLNISEVIPSHKLAIHNSYMQILTEIGIFGLVAFLIFISRLFFDKLKTKKLILFTIVLFVFLITESIMVTNIEYVLFLFIFLKYTNINPTHNV